MLSCASQPLCPYKIVSLKNFVRPLHITTILAFSDLTEQCLLALTTGENIKGFTEAGKIDAFLFAILLYPALPAVELKNSQFFCNVC